MLSKRSADVLKTFEHLKTTFLVCFDFFRTQKWDTKSSCNAFLDLIFIIYHVLKNNLSGFVSRAREIYLPLMHEIYVFSPEARHSRIMRESWQVYYRGRLLVTYRPTISCICKICICTSPICNFCPPKFCTIFVYHFSCVLQPSQEKLKTMLMQNFGGQIRCIMGAVQVRFMGYFMTDLLGGLWHNEL